MSEKTSIEIFKDLFPDVKLFPAQMLACNEAAAIDIPLPVINSNWAIQIRNSGPFPPCENFFKKIGGESDEPLIIARKGNEDEPQRSPLEFQEELWQRKEDAANAQRTS